VHDRNGHDGANIPLKSSNLHTLIDC
jgi:hypothetical protein